MAIKDSQKNIDLELVQEMEMRARLRILEASKMRHRIMREEGIKHDDKIQNTHIIPYR